MGRRNTGSRPGRFQVASRADPDIEIEAIKLFDSVPDEGNTQDAIRKRMQV